MVPSDLVSLARRADSDKSTDRVLLVAWKARPVKAAQYATRTDYGCAAGRGAVTDFWKTYHLFTFWKGAECAS
jgi:hypothetical protein